MISHPYGPAVTLRLSQAADALRAAGADRQLALVLAAIGQAATGLDLRAVDTDQLHGRLAVGAWPINYYGARYTSALAIGGAPGQLAAGTAAQQAQAAVAAWRTYGLAYWPEFASGAWRDALSAAQLRQLPAVVDGRPPTATIDPAGQDAAVRLQATRAGGVASLQAITAAATQLSNTIGGTTSG